MKIPTWRFLLYILVAVIASPVGVGKTAVYSAYAYYFLMAAITLLFMRRDSIWMRFWFPDLKKGILKGLIYFPIFAVLSFIITSIFPVKGSGTPPDLKLSFPLIVLISPVVEELVFRGYVQEYFRQRLKVEWAIIVSSLVFSIFHPIDLFPHAFVSGVFLSYIREASGSLMPGIVVHFLNNLLGFIEVVFFAG